MPSVIFFSRQYMKKKKKTNEKPRKLFARRQWLKYAHYIVQAPSCIVQRTLFAYVYLHTLHTHIIYYIYIHSKYVYNIIYMRVIFENPRWRFSFYSRNVCVIISFWQYIRMRASWKAPPSHAMTNIQTLNYAMAWIYIYERIRMSVRVGGRGRACAAYI